MRRSLYQVYRNDTIRQSYVIEERILTYMGTLNHLASDVQCEAQGFFSRVCALIKRGYPFPIQFCLSPHQSSRQNLHHFNETERCKRLFVDAF